MAFFINNEAAKQRDGLASIVAKLINNQPLG